MSSTNAVVQATEAAVLAAGLDTASDSKGGVNSFALPHPTEIEFSTSGSKACNVQAAFHADARARITEARIDRDLAPLTGLYVIHLDAVTSTYDATAEAPVDIDTLLIDWAAKVLADLPAGYTVAPTVTKAGELLPDAIRITAPTASGTYATYVLGNSTAAPELANLELRVEVDRASVRVWFYPGYTLDEAGEMPPLDRLQARAPTIAADLGPQPAGGYGNRLDVASVAGVWLQLYDPIGFDLVVVLPPASGPGVYTITTVATVIVAPQRVP